MPGAFKLEHLHPIKPTWFWKISIFFTFILGCQFLLPQRPNNGKIHPPCSIPRMQWHFSPSSHKHPALIVSRLLSSALSSRPSSPLARSLSGGSASSRHLRRNPNGEWRRKTRFGQTRGGRPIGLSRAERNHQSGD